MKATSKGQRANRSNLANDFWHIPTRPTQRSTAPLSLLRSALRGEDSAALEVDPIWALNRGPGKRKQEDVHPLLASFDLFGFQLLKTFKSRTQIWFPFIGNEPPIKFPLGLFLCLGETLRFSAQLCDGDGEVERGKAIHVDGRSAGPGLHEHAQHFLATSLWSPAGRDPRVDQTLVDLEPTTKGKGAPPQTPAPSISLGWILGLSSRQAHHLDCKTKSELYIDPVTCKAGHKTGMKTDGSKQ